MKCLHIAKKPQQQQADVTIKSTGVKHTLCMACYEIFKDDPRRNPIESEGYYLYRSEDPSLPKDQWTRVNEKPLPRTGDKMQFKIGKPKRGASYFIRTINAIGLESHPSKVVYIPGVDDPMLLMKSVLLFGETTDEGKLVEAVTLPWFEILELLKNDPSAAFQIPPDKWEEIIAGAYRQSGFEHVTLTPRSGDYGRDVIAEKKGIGTVRIIDQVKAYKPGHLVDANDVRALVGVLHGDGASKAFLTTTSDFAPRLSQDPLITPFMPSRLELINGQKLLGRLLELKK
jgi:restriction system protein